MKNSKFGFKPPKGKQFNLLQKLDGRIFFASEKSVISFLPNYISACKPEQTHEGSPRCCIT